MKPIYLDNNATTRVDPEVLEAMLPYFTQDFGNPSSLHDLGKKASMAVQKARQQVQRLLGAKHDHEIVFSSGGTESDHTAILSALEVAGPGRMEIVTTQVEHPAILALCRHLEETRGTKVHYLPVDSQGRLSLDVYQRTLGPATALVTIMWANNETGTVFPVEALAALARDAGALFHTDAVQAVGKVPIEVDETAIDLLSLSGHKLHGPKGVGALYVRKGKRLRPLFRGGHQERGRRAGTENVPGIVGLGQAAELASVRQVDDGTRLQALRDRLEQELLFQIEACLPTGDPLHRLPNTCTLAFEFVEGEAILHHLNRQGIAASSGSACTSGSLEPSHVLRAMKIPYTAAHGAIRFSLSRENQEEDVDRVLEVLPGIITQLRATRGHRPHHPSKELPHACPE